MFKNAADEDGDHYSAGHLREVPWVAIPPVVTAIRVLERIVPDGGLLFDAAAHAFQNIPAAAAASIRAGRAARAHRGLRRLGLRPCPAPGLRPGGRPR
ncbi:hypothetical protein [Streptomyces pulveraceus]|uniref:Uncharacterized protein n=1 Tax=Streptomyces pulveraceus TaxID=68258 RepID=A0ABW1GVV2_9ACTN